MNTRESSNTVMSQELTDGGDAALTEQPTHGGEFRCGTISLVGETNAGKSTILNALLKEKVSIVSPKPHTTRHRVLGVANVEGGQLVFVDTPGFSREKSSSELAKFVQRELREGAHSVDLTVLVIDTIPLARGKQRVADIVSAYGSRGLGAPTLVLLNKVDVVRKDRLLPIIAETAEALKEAFGTPPPIVPVSAKTGDGVELIASLLLQHVPVAPRMFPVDMVSDQSEEFFAAEIVREKIFLLLQQELPYSVAVKVEHWVDEKTLQRIAAQIYVERDSQKAIVIGKGGQRLKEIGQLARLELEKILGCKVFLELHVRVERDWTKTTQGLVRAGVGHTDQSDGR